MQLRCRSCKKAIFWTRDFTNEPFQYCSGYSEHNHRLFKTKEEAVRNFLLGFPQDRQLYRLRKVAKEKFNISHTHFCSVVRKLIKPQHATNSKTYKLTLSPDKLYEFLEEQNYYYYATDEQNYPNLLMIMNINMRDQY